MGLVIFMELLWGYGCLGLEGFNWGFEEGMEGKSQGLVKIRRVSILRYTMLEELESAEGRDGVMVVRRS